MKLCFHERSILNIHFPAVVYLEIRWDGTFLACCIKEFEYV